MAITHTTLATLRSDLAGRLQNTGFWSAAEETSAINEALRLWQLFTGYWRATKSITLSQNVYYYRTDINPNPLLKPLRVTLSSTPLDLDSAWSMDNGRPVGRVTLQDCRSGGSLWASPKSRCTQNHLVPIMAPC